MFLMPGLICVLHVTKAPYPPGRREAMLTYLRNHQQLDGGWGTHIECARYSLPLGGMPTQASLNSRLGE